MDTRRRGTAGTRATVSEPPTARGRTGAYVASARGVTTPGAAWADAELLEPERLPDPEVLAAACSLLPPVPEAPAADRWTGGVEAAA